MTSPAGKFRSDIRNIAIIAHVDHGKTTLVDKVLRDAGSFRKGEVVAERAMDSNDQERERGITILAKCTAVTWKGVRINIVDTPGHADFGGEVERVLRMVDSVLLLVDAFEGPMPQTRFVTKKALALGLRPILVVNKIDREGCDPHGTVDAVFDLFDSLGATDHQMDFPVIFASGREGWATHDPDVKTENLAQLLDMVIEKVPPPPGDLDSALAMQAATLAYDDYLGYLAIGRVHAGRVKTGDRVALIRTGGAREEFRVQKVLGFQGLKRFELAEGGAGDIVAVTGMENLNVGETITSIESPQSLPPLGVDEPTITMMFCANNGPLVGTEGKWVTTRALRDRLYKEVKSNVALRVEDTDLPDIFKVSGRGELHLAVLIENMRREGFELCVSQPKVIFKEGAGGEKLEPYEDVTIDVESQYQGAVIEKLGSRGGQMRELAPLPGERVRLEYVMPSRGLIGYRSEFMTDTRGTGVLYHVFSEYGPYTGDFKGRLNGVLIAQDPGETNLYALNYLQDRGILFVGPQEKVYMGMIIGQHSRDNDLVVNPSKAKQLTNFRTHAADEKQYLPPPRVMTLEAAMEYINDDELVEVTPKSIRLRKKILDHNARKSDEKKRATAEEVA